MKKSKRSARPYKRLVSRDTEKELAQSATYVVFQTAPYTMVTASVLYAGYRFTANGFSKCIPTDEWKEARGIEIAKNRAIRLIGNKIAVQGAESMPYGFDKLVDVLKSAVDQVKDYVNKSVAVQKYDSNPIIE